MIGKLFGFASREAEPIRDDVVASLSEQVELLTLKCDELQSLLIGTIQKHGLSVNFTGYENINGYTVFMLNDQEGPGFRLVLVNEKVHGHA